jgi:hypothetical protein
MHHYDVGPPITQEYDMGNGIVICGFYNGTMIAFPELDEAWFTEEKELSFKDEPPPLPPTEQVIITAVDISNFQPTGQALVGLLQEQGAEHCIVRLPQRVEPRALYTRASSQIDTVMGMDNCTLGAYGWLYRDVPIEQQVEDWLALLDDAQVKIPYLWLDIEPYETNDNLPNLEQIKQAARLLEQHGVQPGIYTGPWVWALLRNPKDDYLMTLPLWTAEYNGLATLVDVTLYGGWVDCKGHQYWTKPVDLNVFDKSYTVLQPA